jgi:HK97 family phage major capsid protein
MEHYTMRYSVQEQFARRRASLAAFAARFGIRADGEDKTIAAYRARQDELVAKSQGVIAQADADRRELTTDERKMVSDNSAEVERLENEIELRERVAAQDRRLSEPQPRKTAANAGDPPAENDRPQPELQTTYLNSPATRAAARGNGGWHNLGDFARAVRAATVQPGRTDARLSAAATTYGSEGVGADGGFAVPPDYRASIMSIVQSEDALFSRVDASPTSSNSVTVPTDEATAWGTSGVRVYTRAEAAAMTASKPNLKDVTVRLNELYAMVPVTDELLEDAPMLGRLLTTKAGEAFDFAITNYIINGTGAGQPLGIMNAPCLVTVAVEGSQTAATIHALNVAKMWGRMPARARSQAVWLINQDCEQQLMQMGFQVGKADQSSFTGGVPLFVPPGGLSATPYATLMGRPVIATEACATLGTTGDIIFAYLPGYFMPYKAGGIRSDVSIHLYFDQGISTFRWTFRIGGQPWLSAPVGRKNGSNTLSHFVALAAR